MSRDMNNEVSSRFDFGDLVRDDRVHRLIYVEPEIFDQEMTKIFAHTWVFVGHDSEVMHQGDYKTTTIGRQPVIMSRHRDGKIYVMFNRCRHRGAVVCREERGNSERFRCIYHGWTYSNRGDLIGVPYRDGYGEHFAERTLGLLPVPNVEIYRGFVFACLGSRAESLREYLGPAIPYLDLIVDRAPEGEIEVTRGVQKYAYRGNWKLQLENFVDSYHPAFTHESVFERRRYRTGRFPGRGDKGGENVYLGRGHSLIDYSAAEGGPRPIDAKLEDDYIKRLHDILGPERSKKVLHESNMNLAIFPNLLFQSNRQSFRVIKPVRVGYTEIYVYPYRLKGAPDVQNNREVQRLAVWASPAGLGQPDDLEAFERVQEGLQVQSDEWILFNRGVHRERIEKNGEVRGYGADEVAQRGQHREYKRLLCCNEDQSC